MLASSRPRVTGVGFRNGRILGRPARGLAVCVRASAEYEALRGKVAYKASSGDPVELLSLWEPAPTSKAVISFLTHFADLSSWEFAQKLVKVIPTLEGSGVRFLAVGLGSVGNAQEFARTLNFPLDRLYAMPEGGELYRQLGFSAGFAPDLNVNPYLKLVPMLAGVGSPGTVQEVLRGYVGDKTAKPVFDSPTPFDVLGPGYQRPFELATLRLFNMMGILPKWSELCPADPSLLTQQGGCVVFAGEQVVFKHVDSGILRYTDVDEILKAALQADYAPTTSVAAAAEVLEE
ncbi:hypothetical protein VOLCADRAFT_89241 [Volvox carteri f. nagariensis]|uniref:Uncharacterized protein n=1 Tax=Volvox carteri f. nagariensis TaxID=3068 RepID=D8TR67_VOLCA|nr:uncharacterized protein VOLCADRAFT_89241 [Volvox carteri f. nagariensis]EFJ49943.1 hypothetical protein VOLCADRAFT_89241 [Volvox carteri f. nagariensis]|eukprot:XP_002949008.1 hypothetical protein VOLCADRAFT_89241 [Volvox carteri f. nagariensis]